MSDDRFLYHVAHLIAHSLLMPIHLMMVDNKEMGSKKMSTKLTQRQISSNTGGF